MANNARLTTSEHKGRRVIIARDSAGIIAEKILNMVRKEGSGAGRRLRSRDELAGLFQTSPARVRQAILRLKETGYVNTRKGSGVYLTDKASASSDAPPAPLAIAPRGPLFKTVRIQIPVDDDPRQTRMWTKALDAFQRAFPLMHLEPHFNGKQDADSFDCCLVAPVMLRARPDAFLPLDMTWLGRGGLDVNGLCAGILELGQSSASGAQTGLPLLRSTTILAANRRLLERYGLADEPLGDIADFFRIGDQIEARSQGKVSGFNYLGFQHYCTFRGINIREQNGEIQFDRAMMAAFLLALKPYLRHAHFSRSCAELDRMANNELGVCCVYLHTYPWLRERLSDKFELLRLPLAPDGFVTEAAWVGCVPRATKNSSESMLLLGFLASEKAQTLLIEEFPEWLSVQGAALARQKSTSPFPAGTALYDFDLRGYYTQISPKIYSDYVPWAQTEVAKFFLDIQDMEATLDKMLQKQGEGLHEK